MGHGEEIDVPEAALGVFQHILRHRQQRPAVGQRAALAVLRQKPPVLQQRGGGGPGRGFKGQDQHSSAPSMVIFRSVSPRFSIVTRTSSPKKASCTFSLHSTAQIAPRLR